MRIKDFEQALRQSVESGDVSWEAQLLSAHHRLSKTPGPESGDQYDAEQWGNAHSAFHESLVSACSNSWLCRLHKMMFEQNARYRALSVAEDRDLTLEHKSLLDAALARDAEAAVALMSSHIQQTPGALMNQLQATNAFGDTI